MNLAWKNLKKTRDEVAWRKFSVKWEALEILTLKSFQNSEIMAHSYHRSAKFSCAKQ